jgi:hypothetical protein
MVTPALKLVDICCVKQTNYHCLRHCFLLAGKAGASYELRYWNLSGLHLQSSPTSPTCYSTRSSLQKCQNGHLDGVDSWFWPCKMASPCLRSARRCHTMMLCVRHYCVLSNAFKHSAIALVVMGLSDWMLRARIMPNGNLDSGC